MSVRRPMLFPCYRKGGVRRRGEERGKGNIPEKSGVRYCLRVCCYQVVFVVRQMDESRFERGEDGFY